MHRIHMKCIVNHNFHRKFFTCLIIITLKRCTNNKSSMLAVSANILLTKYNLFQLSHLHVFLYINLNFLYIKLKFFFGNIVNAFFLAKMGHIMKINEKSHKGNHKMKLWRGKNELLAISYIIAKHTMWRCKLLL